MSTRSELRDLAEDARDAAIRGERHVINAEGPTADFIAACDPQTVIALLDERDRLRAALEYIRDEGPYQPEASDIASEALGA